MCFLVKVSNLKSFIFGISEIFKYVLEVNFDVGSRLFSESCVGSWFFVVFNNISFLLEGGLRVFMYSWMEGVVVFCVRVKGWVW